MLHNWSNLACCEYAIRSNQFEVAFWLVGFLEVAEVWRVESSFLPMVWRCLTLSLFLWVGIL